MVTCTCVAVELTCDHLCVYVAVELTYGTVYCFKCQDYIYDFSLDEVSRSIEQQVAQNRFVTSRQPVAYLAWEPTRDEIELLKQNPKRKKVEAGSTIGTYVCACRCCHSYCMLKFLVVTLYANAKVCLQATYSLSC